MAITLGPLVLPLPRLFLLLGLAVGLLVAWRLGRRYGRKSDSETILWLAVAVGFVASRLIYVTLHLGYYSEQPLEILKFWDGGFEPFSGVIALALTAFLLVRRWEHPWQPVYVPLAAGLMTWGVLNWFTLAFDRGTHQAMPDLALESLNGEVVQLTEYQGRPLVVNLWASWCPPCRAEMPVLALADEENRDIDFLFINQGEDLATIEEYLSEEELALSHVLRDPFSSASQELNARAMPTTLFYGADGKLITSYTGELNYPRLQDFLRRLH